MIIQYKKRSYMEYKQKQLQFHSNYVGRALKNKTPQEVVNYRTNLYTLGQSINDHFVPKFQLHDVFKVGKNIGLHERFSKSQGW